MLFSNIHVLLPDFSILKNGYVLVQDDQITYVGSKKPETFSGEIYDGTDKLLAPGLVNTHCHVPMTLLRSAGADLPLQRWLQEAIFPIEAKLNAEYTYYGALLGIGEMLRSGVTAFNDMYFYVDSIAKAVLESGISANLSVGILNTDPTIKPEQVPFFQETKSLCQQYHNANGGQLKIDAGIHAEYTSNSELVLAVAEYAKEHHLNIQVHNSETALETNECIQRHGKTPTAYLDSLGVFDNPTTCAHCVHVTKEDIQIFQDKKVSVAHCPASNMKLGSGIAPIAAMIEAGVNVTIGTDGTGSNDNLNMIEDIKLAPLLQRAAHQDSSLLPAKTVYALATRNGACALSRPDTGEISVGKKADLVVYELHSVNLQPAVDILSGLIYAATPDNVALTMARGKVVYKNGAYLTIDMEKVLHQVKEIKKQLYS